MAVASAVVFGARGRSHQTEISTSLLAPSSVHLHSKAVCWGGSGSLNRSGNPSQSTAWNSSHSTACSVDVSRVLNGDLLSSSSLVHLYVNFSSFFVHVQFTFLDRVLRHLESDPQPPPCSKSFKRLWKQAAFANSGVVSRSDLSPMRRNRASLWALVTGAHVLSQVVVRPAPAPARPEETVLALEASPALRHV